MMIKKIILLAKALFLMLNILLLWVFQDHCSDHQNLIFPHVNSPFGWTIAQYITPILALISIIYFSSTVIMLFIKKCESTLLSNEYKDIALLLFMVMVFCLLLLGIPYAAINAPMGG